MESAIDNDASSSEVAEAFKNAVKTSTDGTLVADIPDLYDTCAVRARRINVAHASDLSSPQEGFSEFAHHFHSKSVNFYPRRPLSGF